MSDNGSSFSLGRLMVLLLPILAIALAVNYSVVPGIEQAEQEKLEQNVLSKMLGQVLEPPQETIEFVDEDGDLLCDSPEGDAAVTPEKLVFSYIASSEDEAEADAAIWADLMAAIGEATGLEVEYVHYPSINDQLSAMSKGELHIAGLNTGATPVAAKYSGFIPVCSAGKEDGSFGYTMKIIAPADSGLESPADLTGKKIAFTQTSSNSGFKAALVLLLKEHDLQPDRDYTWGFTYSHEASIKEVANKKYDAASVASDLLQGMIANGEVEQSAITELYVSERFPPAVLGHAHNLTEELRTKISETLLGFDWAGTSVEKEYEGKGVTKYVPVTFKDDWANIRRIDEVVRSAKSAK